jgi:hypothetical protein
MALLVKTKFLKDYLKLQQMPDLFLHTVDTISEFDSSIKEIFPDFNGCINEIFQQDQLLSTWKDILLKG